MFFSQDSPRPFMVTPCREMGLDKLELLTKRVFQDVETLKLLGAENSRCLRELRSLQAAFREGLIIVKTLSNTACPINRLPPEILAHIFALIPRRRPYGDVRTGVHWPFAQTIVEDLHALPKVCRSWRELALATPTLWTTVSTSCSQSEDAIDFSLRHSIYLPEDPSLELKIHLVTPEVVPRIKELLLRNAPRVRELYHLANLPDRELSEVLKSFDAEALENCLLVANPPAPHSSTPLNQARFLPFFSGGGTRLRFLYISGFSFLPANEFPALSCLRLCLDFNTAVSWDLWDLLKFVSGSPRLEEIHICDARFATATPSHNTHGSETPVSLPRLRYLSFAHIPNPGEPADVKKADLLLSHITIPSTCHLSLSVSRASSSTNCAFLDSVRRHIPDKDRVSHLALRPPDGLWEWDGFALHLVFPKGSLRLFFPPPAQRCRGGMLDPEGLLAFLRAQHPDTFAWSTELRVHYNEQVSQDALSLLTEALPPIFPYIKLVSIIGEKRAELEAGLQLLRHQPSAVESSSACAGASAIPYPALETLWVMLNSNELGADSARLRAALVARAALGFPVRRAIVAYRVPESQVPELRQDDVRNLIALEGVVDEVVLMGIPPGERPEEIDWMVWYPEKYDLPADIRRDWPVWSRSGE